MHMTYVLTLDDTQADGERGWIDELTERFDEIELQVGKVMEKNKTIIDKSNTT